MKRRKELIIKYTNKRKKGIERLRKIFSRIQKERGDLTEKKVFEVLKTWKEKGLIFYFEQTSKGSYEDCIRHVDGWFVNLDGDIIEFQIKSSKKGAENHLLQNPEIPVVIIKPEADLTECELRLKEVFKEKLIKRG